MSNTEFDSMKVNQGQSLYEVIWILGSYFSHELLHVSVLFHGNLLAVAALSLFDKAIQVQAESRFYV